MAQTTIEQFATELKMQAGALLEQLAAAGVGTKKAGDKLTEQDKTRLLDYLRKQHGAAADPKKRITLTRKQTSEIKAPDASGKARTIQVEVRKKRVLVRREEGEAAPAHEEAAAPVAEAAPVVEAPVVEVPVVETPVVETPIEPPVVEALVPEPAPVASAEPTPATAAPPPRSHLSAAEIASREAETRKQRELFARQEEDIRRKQEDAERRRLKAEETAKAAAEAAAKAAEAEAKAKAAPAGKTEGTLHRPAAKPGERRDKPLKKTGGPVFSEEAARKRALKLRGDAGAATSATGWRQPKVGARHRDEDGGEGAVASGPVVREILVPETITVAELAHKMSVKAAELIKGPLSDILHVSVDQSKNVEDIKKEIGNAIKKLDKGKGVLVLTDLFGGTPSNISLSFMKDQKVEVVTGVNLPMLLKLSEVKEGMTLREFACFIKEHGQKNIYVASELLSKKALG